MARRAHPLLICVLFAESSVGLVRPASPDDYFDGRSPEDEMHAKLVPPSPEELEADFRPMPAAAHESDFVPTGFTFSPTDAPPSPDVPSGANANDALRRWHTIVEDDDTTPFRPAPAEDDDTAPFRPAPAEDDDTAPFRPTHAMAQPWPRWRRRGAGVRGHGAATTPESHDIAAVLTPDSYDVLERYRTSQHDVAAGSSSLERHYSGFEGDAATEAWSYNYMGAWPMCDGPLRHHQSPIDINPLRISREGSEPRGEDSGEDEDSAMGIRSVTKGGLGTCPSKVNHLQEISYIEVPNCTVENTGHGYQIKANFGCVVMDGISYTVERIRYHSPSEHSVGGALADGELQITHKNRNGKILNFAILFSHGAIASPFIEQLLGQGVGPTPASGDMHHGAGGRRHVGTVELHKSLRYALSGSYWMYKGSETVPPCSEGVDWIVFQRHAPLTQKLTNNFRVYYEEPWNHRPVQALNGRKVLCGDAPHDHQAAVAGGKSCMRYEAYDS